MSINAFAPWSAFSIQVTVALCVLAGCSERNVEQSELIQHAHTPEAANSSSSLPIQQAAYFDVVTPGAFVRKTFVVKNSSARPLNVKKAWTSCGCLSIEEYPDTISAGGEQSVALVLDTSGLRGLIEQYAVLSAIDGRSHVLSVKGLVRGVWSEPSVLELGNVRFGESKQAHFYLMSAGVGDLEVKEATPSSEALQVNVFKAQSGDRLVDRQIQAASRIDVRWSGTKPLVGRQPFAIKITTSSEDFKNLTVPVNAYGVGLFECRPPRLLLTDAKPGDYITEKVAIHTESVTADAQLLNIHDVRFSANHEFVHVSPISDSDVAGEAHLRVRAKVPIDSQAKTLSGEIVGSTAEGPVLMLPYVIYASHTAEDQSSE